MGLVRRRSQLYHLAAEHIRLILKPNPELNQGCPLNGVDPVAPEGLAMRSSKSEGWRAMRSPVFGAKHGAPGGDRTHNLRLRRPTTLKLYKGYSLACVFFVAFRCNQAHSLKHGNATSNTKE